MMKTVYSVIRNKQVPNDKEWNDWRWEEDVIFRSQSEKKAIEYFKKTKVSDQYPIFELYVDVEEESFGDYDHDSWRVAIKDDSDGYITWFDKYGNEIDPEEVG